jgi:tetratricopeptide (TPR) repeat protein
VKRVAFMAEPTVEPTGAGPRHRRGGRVRGWLVRNRIRIASGVTGLGAFMAALVGFNPLTVRDIVMALLIGSLTALPVPLIDGTIRSAVERSSEPPVPPPPELPAAPPVSADVPPPPPPPERLSTFRGRTAELAELVALHARERRSREQGDNWSQAVGPVLLLIHGKPGVGKSVLAYELAGQLAEHYPDGVVTVNFGVGGEARPPAEILKTFLLALSPSGREIPGDTTDRANLFRSLTAGRRILFIFDAARHHDQVLQVLPTEPGCAVIVTSRRDLSPALNAPTPWRGPLEVPSVDEALEILAAVSRTDWTAQAEPAIEVVDLCGRLPVAIKSAAERVALDGTDLRHVADLLRPDRTRLAWLERSGRGVTELFESEYRRLGQSQQRALRLLPLVESPTFVPWVLRPLLDIGHSEAENVMAALGTAQLLDNAGHDQATGLARYRFNPLVKLFAEAKLTEYLDDPEHHEQHRREVAEARARLDGAYLELVDGVLAELGDGYAPRRVRYWIPNTSRVPGSVAGLPDHGVRAEYNSLVHLVRAAQDNEHEMCWRVAVRLQGCVPERASLRDSSEAFNRAVEAARVSGNPLAEIDVQLAKAAFLVALERYPAAFDVLTEADRAAADLQARGGGAGAGVRRAIARRKLAEAYLQMAAYRLATAQLARAAGFAEHAGSAEELRLIRLLSAENHRVPSPDPSYADILEGRVDDDRVYFRAQLGLSEAARRRGHWTDAEEHLRAAESHSSGDARRAATVHYRLARLHLGHWRNAMPDLGLPRPGPEPDGPAAAVAALPAMALRHAAEAALVFQRMENPVGLVRARCQQVRALVIAGQLVEAEQLCDTVWHSLAEPVLRESPARGPVLARFARARGELLLHRGDVGTGWRMLGYAATLYGANDDWASHAEIWRLLAVVQRCRAYPANGRLASVEGVLEDAIASVASVHAMDGPDGAAAVHVPQPRVGTGQRFEAT